MKALTKRIYLTALTAIFTVCLLLSGAFAFSRTTSVKADSATLEAEFTNEGQFSLSQYGGNTLEYVDYKSLGTGEGAV